MNLSLDLFGKRLFSFSTLPQSAIQKNPLDTDDGIVYVPIPQKSFGVVDTDQADYTQQKTAYRGIVYRCVHLRADAVVDAVSQFTVERQVDQNIFEQVEGDHPWFDLLRAPNPNMSAYELWRWVSMARDLSGHSDFIVERDKRRVPIGLYPIYSWFGTLRPRPDAYGGVENYIYFRNDGKLFEVEPEDVLRITHPHPLTPYETASVIQAAGYQIDTDLYLRVYRRNEVRDGGHSKFALVSEQELTKAQMELYGKDFKEKFMGVDNIKNVPVLGKGLKPTSLAVNSKDLEFIEGARLNNEEVMSIFGVPSGLLSDRSNRANASESRLTFYQNTVQPEAELIAAQMSYGFEKMFGATQGVLHIRVPNIMPIDQEFEMKRDQTNVQYGLTTINEVRQRDGFEPVDGGDTLLVPTNVQPLEVLVQKVKAAQQNPDVLLNPVNPNNQQDNEKQDGAEQDDKADKTNQKVAEIVERLAHQRKLKLF